MMSWFRNRNKLSYSEAIEINDYLREEAKKWKADIPYNTYIDDKQSELYGKIDGKTFHIVYCNKDILDIIMCNKLNKNEE